MTEALGWASMLPLLRREPFSGFRRSFRLGGREASRKSTPARCRLSKKMVDRDTGQPVVPNMNNIDTSEIDAGWPALEDIRPAKLPQNRLEDLCAPLVAAVRGRKARNSTIPGREEVALRKSLFKMLDELGVAKVEGRDWKISLVPTRFKDIGGELLPIADESLRVTLCKTQA